MKVVYMEEKTEISIPGPLYEKLRKKIEDTEFSSVSDYVLYVLGELASEDETEESISKQDEEKIKSRLRSLGYLD